MESQKSKINDNLNVKQIKNSCESNIQNIEGITILEALSATGLRSIRYAKEIPGVKEIIANDISQRAVDVIKNNAIYNEVHNIVVPSHSDAM